MFELTYTNSRGQSVKIGAAPPIMLTKCTGIEGAKNNVDTVKSPDQDGETFTGMSLDKGERTITGSICAPSSSAVETYRRQLVTAFNTKIAGTLLFTDKGTGISKSCDCKVENITFGDPNGQVIDFDITLLCPNPFWHDIADSVDEIALWLPGFEFDSDGGFEFPDDGMEFGERAPSLIVDVENPGDVPCGMKIIFTALGKIVNPSIFNVDTREYFKILKTMQADEIIEINTKFGEKNVTGLLSGTESDYFNYADLPDSTFMQLVPGDNPLRYDAESGLDSLNVTIRYSPQYLGV